VRQYLWHDEHYPKDKAQHPVVLVSHDDAQAYAKWLSEKTGKHLRLPTEAEWEKAMRGTKANLYPWGNRYRADALNNADEGPFATMPVASFPQGKSPYGVMDGAGQVYEWTNQQRGDKYLVKGGSWDDHGGVCRPAARHFRPQKLKHIIIGFRLVDVSQN
jgi:formylglycine-generating enzyme required for sulfatase activity